MAIPQAAIAPVAPALKLSSPPGIERVGAGDRLDGLNPQFSGAMARAGQADAAARPVQLAQLQVNKPGQPAAIPGSSSADAAARARQTLGLDTPVAAPAAPAGGDSILNGLQKLRSVFDQQQNRLNTAMAAPAADAKTLLALQMEVVNFTILVDVSSKLTGKSTQALETLLKGQ